jgi:hypothetical protein
MWWWRCPTTNRPPPRCARWLIVFAPDDERAAKVAEAAKAHGARMAEKYHRLVIEDLL